MSAVLNKAVSDVSEDEDDFYDSPVAPSIPSNTSNTLSELPTPILPVPIPGLGLLSSVMSNANSIHEHEKVVKPILEAHRQASHQLQAGKSLDDSEQKHVEHDESLAATSSVLEKPHEQNTHMKLEETVNSFEHSATDPAKLEQTQCSEHQASAEEQHTKEEPSDTSIVEAIADESVGSNNNGDREFIEAAMANHGNNQAEWEYDSSPAESSDSDSSDSDSDSDDSDDVDYELLTPEEQARILMQADDGSDDEGTVKRGGPVVQPRTANEKPEEKLPKPDIVITPEMPISELGLIEQIVDALVLVKGTVSAETRVLESGSVLCLEDRKVIGVIMEPIGRVEEPYYSVAFTNAAEIAEYGLRKGTKVYYVESHAHYLFTKPLMVKGSDASNVHDEEVQDDEIEFSDDEAEAEYKRMKKQAKKARKGHNQVSGPNDAGNTPSSLHPLSAAQIQYPSQPMNYDDDDMDDEMYTPLTRPTGIHELNGAKAPSQRQNYSGLERGRGGYRGQADRGSRGGYRGQADRGGRGRGGGRDNRGHQPYPRRGDREGGRGANHNRGNRGGNDDASQQSSETYELASKFSASTASNDFQNNAMSDVDINPHAAHFSGNTGWAENPYQQNPQSQPLYNPLAQPWNYVDASQEYNPNYSQASYQAPPSMMPGGSMPVGAFVNPTFFQNQHGGAAGFTPMPQYSQYQLPPANFYPQQQQQHQQHQQQQQYMNPYAQQMTHAWPQQGSPALDTQSNVSSGYTAPRPGPQSDAKKEHLP